MYADDSKLYKTVNNLHDCVKLETDLDQVFCWSIKWDIKLNVDLSKCMSFCRNRNKLYCDFIINGSILEKVSQFCDLGLVKTCK